MRERAGLRYEGKAKRVYHTSDPDVCVIEFTDRATAFNGEKTGQIDGKGGINAATTAVFCELLERAGVATHFVRRIDDSSIEARNVDIVPLEVVVRNIAAGSFSRRLGVPEGEPLAETVVEFSYKRDDLGDPLVTRAHIRALRLADDALLDELERRAHQVNDILRGHLAGCGITLVDFKLEFGHTPDGTLLLADEISPDTCRFWDAETGEKLDKDRFRRDLGGVEDAYEALLARLNAARVPA